MSTNETVDNLKLKMARAAVNNEVTQNLELFEICIRLVPVSTYARIKLLTINIAKDIHHLDMSHETKLRVLEECNKCIRKLVNAAKDHPDE